MEFIKPIQALMVNDEPLRVEMPGFVPPVMDDRTFRDDVNFSAARLHAPAPICFFKIEEITFIQSPYSLNDLVANDQAGSLNIINFAILFWICIHFQMAAKD